jgi:hypothetical protein
MNKNPILPAYMYFFFHLFSAPKFSPLLPTTYLPLLPTTYHPLPPPTFTPSLVLRSRPTGVSLELELWLWSWSVPGVGAVGAEKLKLELK